MRFAVLPAVLVLSATVTGAASRAGNQGFERDSLVLALVGHPPLADLTVGSFTGPVKHGMSKGTGLLRLDDGTRVPLRASERTLRGGRVVYRLDSGTSRRPKVTVMLITEGIPPAIRKVQLVYRPIRGRRIVMRDVRSTSLKAIFPERTKILDSVATAALSSVSTGDSVLVFSTATLPLETLQPGDILLSGVTSHTPRGLLRKVVSVSQSAAGVVVTTGPASIEEAVAMADLELGKTIAAQDIRRFVPALPGVSLVPKAGGGPEEPRAEASLVTLSLKLDGVAIDAGGGRRITFEGGLSLQPSVDILIRIPWGSLTVQEARFGADVQATGSIGVSVDGELAAFQKHIVLGHVTISPIDIWGPVVLVPEVDLVLDFEGSFDAAASTSASAQADFTTSVDWTPSGGWVLSHDLHTDFPQPMIDVSASASAKVALGPELIGYINDVAGPTASVEGYLQAKADTSANPWWSLVGGLEGRIGFKAQILSFTIADYQSPPLELQIPIQQAPGPFACVPNSTRPCYDGPSGTAGVGPCRGGTQTCKPDASGYGPCVGEVLPAPERCADGIDNDCNGTADCADPACAASPRCITGTTLPGTSTTTTSTSTTTSTTTFSTTTTTTSTTTTTTLSPSSCITGLTAAAGLAVDPRTDVLYVKSGTSGTLWRITDTGTVSVASQDMGTAVDLAIDGTGAVFAPQLDTNTIRRLRSDGTSDYTYVYPYDYPAGGVAIESPGLPTNHLFYAGRNRDLWSLTLSDWAPASGIPTQQIGGACAAAHHLVYRPSLHNLAGAAGNVAVSISVADGTCSTIATGFVQAEGVAWDDVNQVLYVSDAAAGTVTQIPPVGASSVVLSGAAAPAGLAFDPQRGQLFVAEPGADRVCSVTVAAPNPGRPRGGFTRAAGIAVDPRTDVLYVKSGTSGTLWRITDTGTVSVASQDMGTAVDLAIDGTGAVFAPQLDTNTIRRLRSDGTSDYTYVYPYDYPAGGVAIESPGLPTNHLFYAGRNRDLWSLTLSDWAPASGIPTQQIGGACAAAHHLVYRPSLHNLAGAAGNVAVSISVADGTCSTIATGFVQAEGVAWDDVNQVLYVSDSGTGRITKIPPTGPPVFLKAPQLAQPTGMVFDPVRDEVVIAETGADNVVFLSK